jgi:prophage DNA circulation protein
VANNDALADTFPFGWRDVHAPCRTYENHGQQDSADHKRVDRDGARIELMGRNPYEFKVSILFINGLTPGPNEQWGGNLYPGEYQKFVAAFEDRSTGVFVHPVFGPINCKCLSFTDRIDAELRNGVIVEALFRDTLVDDTSTAISLGTVSAFSTASVAAGDLDAASADGSISSPIPPIDPSDPTQSFSGFVTSVQGIANTSDFLGQQFGQKITGAISTANGIADTFSSQQAPNTQVRIVDSAFRLSSSLRAMQEQQLAKAKATAVYTVPRTTTLGALSGRLGNSIDDLMALNPSALSKPTVPSGAVITYYS